MAQRLNFLPACMALLACFIFGSFAHPASIVSASSSRGDAVSTFSGAAQWTSDEADATLFSTRAITNTTQARGTVYLPNLVYPPKGFYVSPGGTSRGDGSASKPWDLKTALANPPSVKPGSTIWLRGGKYGSVDSKLVGTAQQPIVVRQYPGERAIIDGNIMAYGAYTWFWGFEITNSRPRIVNDTDPNRRRLGLGLYGPGHKAINLILYNTGHPAISFEDQAKDGEIYGCIIWGTGQYEGDVIRGSGIYAQNLAGARLISDIISFRNFTTGMKTWSQSGAYGNGFTFEGVISFDNGDRNIFAGSSGHPLDTLTILNNYTYRRPGDLRLGVQLGYDDSLNNTNLMVKNNYFVNGDRSADNGALSVSYWASGEVSDNTIVSRKTIAAYAEPDLGLGKTTWKNNHFVGPTDSYGYTDRNGSFNLINFAAWSRNIGFDSTNTFSRLMPSGTQVFVRPNKYEQGRGHIAIFNWDQKDRVAVDLSGVLKRGRSFRIYDAQNLLGAPVVRGVYDGSPVSIPMNLTGVSPIPGEVSPLQNIHTPVEFGAYVVISN